jgi:fatty acid desaturase
MIKAPGFFTRHGIVTFLLIIFALFYLLAEHRAHLFGILPWLILLLCPLMFLFMHHGHDDEPEPEQRKKKEKR